MTFTNAKVLNSKNKEETNTLYDIQGGYETTDEQTITILKKWVEDFDKAQAELDSLLQSGKSPLEISKHFEGFNEEIDMGRVCDCYYGSLCITIDIKGNNVVINKTNIDGYIDGGELSKIKEELEEREENVYPDEPVECLDITTMRNSLKHVDDIVLK